MKTVNSISGGKTSCYMAIHFPADLEIFACVCIDAPECAPKDQAIIKYCMDKLDGNFIASAEHDLTLKVMMELEQILGKEIVWVRGKSFDQIINENSSLPSWKRRFCTTEMKIIPIFEYTFFRFGKVIMNIGFRADERERILKGIENVTINYPIHCNNFGQKRLNWDEVEWREPNFPLSKTFHYDIIIFLKSFYTDLIFPPDSNCRGCPNKPEPLIKKNWKQTPKVLEWFARQEEKKTGRKNHTWKDSMIPYRDIFKMNFTEEIYFENHTMCDSGDCGD